MPLPILIQLPDTSWLEALRKEWPVLKQAPYSFLSSLGILLSIGWGTIWLLHRGRLARYKEEIECLERDIERLEKDRTPRPQKIGLLSSVMEVWRDRRTVRSLRSGRNAFSAPPSNIISKQRYENYSLEVDGNSYQDCSFKNVTFIFHGTAPFEFRGLIQLEKGEFVFHSDDPAVHNFEVMKEQFIRLSKGEAEVGMKDVSGFAVAPPNLRIAPTIVKVSDWIEDGTPNSQLRYPLKLRAQFRNDSPMSVGVRLEKYTANRAPAMEPSVSAVLQIKLHGAWLPAPDAEDFVAVAPTQHFRLWVGIDHSKTTAIELERHKGELGTLSLAVNGDIVNFAL
ncbi:MAG TPA: hypothetical protein VMH04_14025 [Candidatus Solibacter sp.]|nr:hypothetical protein [Candidatus Solibacter sp.]